MPLIITLGTPSKSICTNVEELMIFEHLPKKTLILGLTFAYYIQMLATFFGAMEQPLFLCQQENQ